MILIEKYNVTEEIKKIGNNLGYFLKSYLKRLPLEIDFMESDVSLNICFKETGFLGLFLFNQEDNINNFVNFLNKNKSIDKDTQSYINMVLWSTEDEEDDYSDEDEFYINGHALNVGIGFEHNLNENEIYQFVSYLAKIILTSKNFSIVNKKIDLKLIFNQFYEGIMPQYEKLKREQEKSKNNLLIESKKIIVIGTSNNNIN